MQSNMSKVLLELRGKPIIQRVVETLFTDPRVREVVLAVPASESEVFGPLFERNSKVKLVTGGDSRRASVSNALKYLEQAECLSDLVLIHDGARALLSSDLLTRCIDAALEFGAVTAAIPIVDTVKRCDSELLAKENIDRENLWAIQTPQIFKREVILEAHRKYSDDSTDDATLVQRIHSVKMVMGERSNLKITTPKDLELAEKLLCK